MKVLITGGMGFVGRSLSRVLLEQGDRVVALGRSPHPAGIGHPLLTYRQADTTLSGNWQALVAESDAVVNLAGISIFRRWSAKIKKQIRDSRIETTRNLVDALPSDGTIPLVSTSAVGYYGNCGEAVVTETQEAGDDFLARLSVEWEAAALQAEKTGTRVVLARFGVVLGKGGGAMGQMVPLFRKFFGGPLGSGRQWFPWIHMTDLVNGILFALRQQDLTGAANFTAPQPVRNRELAAALGRALKRPHALPAPGFMIRLALGEFADTLLTSQRVVPDKLVKAGFSFTYPDIRSAISEIVAPPA